MLLYLKDDSPVILQSSSSKLFNRYSKIKLLQIISLMSIWRKFLLNYKTFFFFNERWCVQDTKPYFSLVIIFCAFFFFPLPLSDKRAIHPGAGCVLVQAQKYLLWPSGELENIIHNLVKLGDFQKLSSNYDSL